MMKIIPLTEGNFLVSSDKVFTRLEDAAGMSGLRMAINSFLVITPSDYVLIDGGVGWQKDGKSVILDILAKHHIRTDQITKVILSHLHKDHTLGLFQKIGDEYEFLYPNACIYLQEREYDFALEQIHNPAYDVALLKALRDLDHVEWQNEDFGFISSEICFEVTGGHSPYHQVFWIKDEDETLFYGGDNLPQRGYLDINIAYKSDFDGRKALDLRVEWKEKALNENWTILLYHDMKYPIFKITE